MKTMSAASGVRSPNLRAGLKAGAAAAALALMSQPALAQNATWDVAPANNVYNNNANWTPGSFPDFAGNSAFFGDSSITNIVLTTDIEVSSWVFDAPEVYVFFTDDELGFYEDGIVVNDGVAALEAGPTGLIRFHSDSSAGGAMLLSNNLIWFRDQSTAGQSVIHTASTGQTLFSNTATAGQATITVELGGELIFDDHSSADAATITVAGQLDFGPDATAGSAEIQNNGVANFSLGGDAGSATITNAGTLRFFDTSDARNATIRNEAGALLGFVHATSAGEAAITNVGSMIFSDAATAADATIVNGGTLAFDGTATGGDATITNAGLIQLVDDATLGNATLINAAGGVFDLSGLNPFATATAGSIEGAGQINLGLNHALWVGGNNLSTEYSGVISGAGLAVLIKTGDGALTLTGANTYTGGTAVLGGQLIVNTTSLTGLVQTDATLIFDQGAAGTFAGPISGTGEVIKAGAGALTLTGANVYSGGTIVAAGTLIGDTTSLQGDIQNDATLTFDQAANGVFAGAISGAGLLIKDGAGMLTLTGANTHTGGTSIVAGALRGDATSLQGDFANQGNLIFDQGADGVFAGVISGTGLLIKEGAGALTLTGAHTYSGGTLVLAGELIGDATSLQGDFANSAVLTFDQAVDGAYGGVVSGAGDLVKTGDGALTLSGLHSYTGQTFVDGGALIVDGSIATSSDLFVAVAGRLGGTGSVGSTQIAGTVAPGNSIGTLNVIGNAVFAPGSVYEVEINAAGQSDLIAATGLGVINGGVVEVVLFPDFALGVPYTILTAAGGVAGAFDSAEWAGGSLFLSPSLTYGANDVVMTIAQSADFDTAAGTANQAAAADGAQSLGAGALFNAVAVLGDQQEAQDAFDAISGEIHASAATALVEDSRFVREAATGRLRTVAPDERGAWAHAYGVRGDSDSDGNAAALDRSGEGVFFGADGAIGDGWRGGVLAGYSRSSLDADDRASSGSASSVHLGAYGGVQSGRLAVRFGGAFSWHDIEVDRTAAFAGFADSLTADYSAETGQLFAEAGYGFEAGGAHLEPFGALAWVSHATDRFTETGGDAALTGESDGDVAFATVGLRASTRLADHGGARLSGMAGWRHAFGDNPPTSRHAFITGGDAFIVAGVPLAEDALVLEGGVDMQLAPGATFRLDYSGQLASEAADHSLMVRLGLRF